MSITREILSKEWHGIEIENYQLPKHVVDWLNNRIGQGHWFIKGRLGGQTIYFDSEKDHFLFLMTWGQSG